jgi:hypothetical protein
MIIPYDTWWKAFLCRLKHRHMRRVIVAFKDTELMESFVNHIHRMDGYIDCFYPWDRTENQQLEMHIYAYLPASYADHDYKSTNYYKTYGKKFRPVSE